MKRFELYGDVYPEDSKYARLMAQYMMTPNYDNDSKKEWELYRDFAVKKRMSDKDMNAFMVAKDSGHHNMILGHSPRGVRDMEQVYTRQFGNRTAADECSGKTDTMDYVKCRATKMEKEQGTPADKAFPTAWSIACKYKRDQLSDADEHCQKKPSEYFKSKKANGESMKKKTAEAELELMAGHTPESFKKMMKDNPELAEEWEKQIKENEGVVASLVKKWAGCEKLPPALRENCENPSFDKSKKKDSKDPKKEDKEDGEDKKDKKAHLNHRQENLLKRLRNPALTHDGLSPRVQQRLHNELVKEVDAWLSEEYFGRSLMATGTMEAGVSDLFSKPHESVRNFVAEEDITAKFEKGVSADPTENMSPEDKKKWEEMKDKHGDKFKQAQDKTARLMKRQIKVLEAFAQGRPSIPMFFEALPPKTQQALKRIKYQETLEMDVERWLSDYRMEQQINQNRWASNNQNRSAEENPMNKIARATLRSLTANWGLTVDETYEMLAEDELGEYLSEMEAEMWAEEMEAGRSKNPANSGFEVYETQKKPSKPVSEEAWWEDNKSNKGKGGNGAGGTKNFNRNYHEYGEMAGKSEKDYQKSYYQKRFVDNKQIKRKTCPKFHGKKGPCDAPLSKAT